jgi:hypothetical protein
VIRLEGDDEVRFRSEYSAPLGIPLSDEVVGFAPPPMGSLSFCVSRSGRVRPDHDLDRDGRCIYCSPPRQNGANA